MRGGGCFPRGITSVFSEWVSKSQLATWEDGTPIGMDERAAATWAAGNARTVRVSGFGTPTPPNGSHLAGWHLREARHRIAFGVEGRAKTNPASTYLTKTVTLNALSRCFVCPERGIMLNSYYGM
jgi:hypothetical protein